MEKEEVKEVEVQKVEKDKKTKTYTCKKCGNEISKGHKFCPHCGKKPQKHFFAFCITILALFLIVDLISQIVPSIILSSVFSGKYGTSFLIESLLVLVVLIVMLLSKNSYVFTQKQQKFGKAVLQGWPILIMSGVYLVMSILSAEKFIPSNILNLMLYCLTIGLYEEFLCRGWVQNEFIERFGSNKKQVIMSILASSLIFGGMHITNALFGQSLFETIIQVVFAVSAGVFLGSVYYKTKNIWAVIFLHGFYDFTIFLGEHALIRECSTGNITGGIFVDNIISLIITCSFYVIGSIWVLKNCKFGEENTNTENLVENKQEKTSKMKNIGLIVATVIVFALMFLPISFGTEEEYEKYNTCYTYKEKTIGEHAIKNYYTYSFEIKHTKNHVSKLETPIEIVNPDGTISVQTETTKKEDFNLKVYLDTENLNTYIENVNTKEKIVLDDSIKNLNTVVVIENNDHYLIAVSALDQNVYSKVYYTKIMKDELSNEKGYLKKILDSFETFDLPYLGVLGSIEIVGDENTYVYMMSDVYDEFYIDSKGDLYNFTMESPF